MCHYTKLRLHIRNSEISCSSLLPAEKQQQWRARQKMRERDRRPPKFLVVTVNQPQDIGKVGRSHLTTLCANLQTAIKMQSGQQCSLAVCTVSVHCQCALSGHRLVTRDNRSKDRQQSAQILQ